MTELTLDELMRQIDSLPNPASRKAFLAHKANEARRQSKLFEQGGTITTLYLGGEANNTVKWALAQPGGPETRRQLLEAALLMYEQAKRGSPEVVRRCLDHETTGKLNRMLLERPDMVEGELITLAIKHLFHSFQNSPDGKVDT